MIRENVKNFITHNEIMLGLNLNNQQRNLLENDLIKLVEDCITTKENKCYTISLASEEQLNIMQTNTTLTIADDFGQTLEEFDLEYSNNDVDELLSNIQKLELYDYLDGILGIYDFSECLEQLVDTYIEDIIIGHGEDVVRDEVEQINHNFDTLNEKDFCADMGIYKIGNMYIKGMRWLKA